MVFAEFEDVRVHAAKQGTLARGEVVRYLRASNPKAAQLASELHAVSIDADEIDHMSLRCALDDSIVKKERTSPFESIELHVWVP